MEPAEEAFVETEDFQKLVLAMNASPRPLALIGAGASIPSGYPSWDGLVRDLASLVQERSSGADEGQTTLAPKYSAFIKNQDPAWQAEEFKRALTKTVFNRYLRETFGKKEIVTEPYHLIAKLGFSHFLTTNFDPCIGQALKAAGEPRRIIDWHDFQELNRFLCDVANKDAQRYVVHLHGRSAAPEDVILTETSYVNRYLKDDDTRLKLLALFMTHPVVFIGFSMNDPDLMQLLREVAARVRTAPPRHFAIIGFESDEERQATTRRMEGKFGVSGVFYRIHKRKDLSRDHSGLLHLLKALADRTGIDTSSRTPDISFPAKAYRVDDYDSDPNKGRFGGSSTANGRRLRLEGFRVIEKKTWLALRIVVESDRQPLLSGKIRLHLHPTFEHSSYKVNVDAAGAARETIEATGAFTVGVEADQGRTRLELDLAAETSLPAWFRQR